MDNAADYDDETTLMSGLEMFEARSFCLDEWRGFEALFLRVRDANVWTLFRDNEFQFTTPRFGFLLASPQSSDFRLHAQSRSPPEMTGGAEVITGFCASSLKLAKVAVIVCCLYVLLSL